MNTIYQVGDKLAVNANHNYEDNCCLCAKPLGNSHFEVLAGDLNEIITTEEYNRRANTGDFYQTLPVGSTCAKKFNAEVLNKRVAA